MLDMTGHTFNYKKYCYLQGQARKLQSPEQISIVHCTYQYNVERLLIFVSKKVQSQN